MKKPRKQKLSVAEVADAIDAEKFPPPVAAPKELRKLIGFTIIDVFMRPNTDPGFGMSRPDLYLTVQKGSEVLAVYVQQDAEGNGPGWLNVKV